MSTQRPAILQIPISKNSQTLTMNQELPAASFRLTGWSWSTPTDLSGMTAAQWGALCNVAVHLDFLQDAGVAYHSGTHHGAVGGIFLCLPFTNSFAQSADVGLDRGTHIVPRNFRVTLRQLSENTQAHGALWDPRLPNGTAITYFIQLQLEYLPRVDHVGASSTVVGNPALAT